MLCCHVLLFGCIDKYAIRLYYHAVLSGRVHGICFHDMLSCCIRLCSLIVLSGCAVVFCYQVVCQAVLSCCYIRLCYQAVLSCCISGCAVRLFIGMCCQAVLADWLECSLNCHYFFKTIGLILEDSDAKYGKCKNNASSCLELQCNWGEFGHVV